MSPDIRVLTFGAVDFDRLRAAIDWQQRSVTVYGKTYPQPRLTRWYGDMPYVYSGLRWEADRMPEFLQSLCDRVESLTGEKFNSVLCNLYRDGSDTVGWHADDEPIFGGDPVVASLSFGASRTFLVRHKVDQTRKESYVLTNGSLLVMGRGVQTSWQHTIPRVKGALGPRINLTFRRTV